MRVNALCSVVTPQGNPRLGRIVDRREEATFGTGPEEIVTVEVAGSRLIVPASEVTPRGITTPR